MACRTDSATVKWLSHDQTMVVMDVSSWRRILTGYVVLTGRLAYVEEHRKKQGPKQGKFEG